MVLQRLDRQTVFRVGQISRTWTRLLCTPRKEARITPLEPHAALLEDGVIIGNSRYEKDGWTNVTPKTLSHIGRNLHLQKHHPISLIKRRIVDFFYNNFHSRTRSPKFTVFDNLSPVVTLEQNFDSLLVPKDHVSRTKSDCYYVNEQYLLRAHTTAHQSELIRMGMNHFLIAGDVYRRDEIDKSHYPVFHQLDAVSLYTNHDLFENEAGESSELEVFERVKTERTAEKQESHTLDAVYIMTQSLKSALNDLSKNLFGKDVETRWVDAYFPFTHPSFELEVKVGNEWIEVLGCGIMEQSILQRAGADDKIGWAFGLGLERLAMKLYDIPDIRLFWSTDEGFLHQFKVDDPATPVKYKAVSQFPPCTNDMSFWLPQNSEFKPNDFYDIVRNIGGDVIERVHLVDEFLHPKKQRWSHCYRIVYRHMFRTLRQNEVNEIHKQIQDSVIQQFNVEIR